MNQRTTSAKCEKTLTDAALMYSIFGYVLLGSLSEEMMFSPPV